MEVKSNMVNVCHLHFYRNISSLGEPGVQRQTDKGTN